MVVKTSGVAVGFCLHSYDGNAAWLESLALGLERVISRDPVLLMDLPLLAPVGDLRAPQLGLGPASSVRGGSLLRIS